MHRARRFRAVHVLSVALFVVPLLAGCSSQAPATPTVAATTAAAATTGSAPSATTAGSAAS
ncbi:MAG: hypothetical protein LC793_21400, partial [Thermomicrobia bacterium]|nr:hypothetical protein [Thermomicrobia bacterium]